MVETRRPSTPQNHSRSLFGADQRKFGSRPPSAVNFDPQLLDASDPSSRPSSGAKLPPLNHVPVCLIAIKIEYITFIYTLLFFIVLYVKRKKIKYKLYFQTIQKFV